MDKFEELNKRIDKLTERIAVLEEKIRDGKNYVVTNGAYDIDDITTIVALRIGVSPASERIDSFSSMVQRLPFAPLRHENVISAFLWDLQ